MKENTKKQTQAKESTTLPASTGLKLLGKGIISNQACIDSGKSPWYLSVIVFLLSLVLACIPLLSKGYTSNNATVFNASGNAEIDRGFKTVIASDYFKKFNIKSSDMTLDMTGLDTMSDVLTSSTAIKDEYDGKNADYELAKGKFIDTVNGTDANFQGQLYASKTTTVTTEFTNKSAVFYYDCIHLPSDGTIDNPTSTSTSTTSTSSSAEYENNGYTTYLMTYYLPTVSTEDDKYALFLNNFISTVILAYTSEGSITNYPHSFTLVTKDYIYLYVYALKSAVSNSAIATFGGNLRDGFSMDSSITSDTSLYAYLFSTDGDITSAYDKFMVLMNNSTRAAAITSLWINCGYLAAIYAGTILVAAAVLLYMHKRKTSINRDVNFLNTLFEAIAFGFIPAVLALILGFFNFTYAVMAIIGGVLIRIVWSSSKLTPPVAASEDKPLYQARS
ncbi:MAG: hypothetical protein WCR67_00760 [Bacilli bacterium]